MVFMAKEKEKEKQRCWGTWEELVLACAVKRHGFKSWDSVSMELQAKTSLPHILTTAENCKQKYHDLNQRFTNNQQIQIQDDETTTTTTTTTTSAAATSSSVNIPWIEELRKLRVAELKRDVQLYDVSILALQLKVKKLEEEREKTSQDNQNNQGIPDLEQDRSEKDKNNKSVQERTEEESDRENRSVNESNSTGSENKIHQTETAKLEADPASVEPGSNSKPVVEEESMELGDSVTQLSSEVQSSASLGNKRKREGRRRRKEVSGGDDDNNIGMKKLPMTKSEPLVALLEMIRSHKHGSLFEVRLPIQESEVYSNAVRQHLDLEGIETRLEQGSYSSSTLLFYRDLLLLFNNAIVFFPKPSAEWDAAQQLRSLVSNHIKNETTHKSESTQPPPQNNPPQCKTELQPLHSSLLKHKPSLSNPIVVCRKHSSMSAKSSSSSIMQKTDNHHQQQQQQQSNGKNTSKDLKPPVVEKSLLDIKSQEKPVTGTRSSRRSNKNLNKGAITPSKKQNASPNTKVGAANKSETPEVNKKKSKALALEKKQGAADFLKRIKKSSPVETLKKNSNNNNRGGGERKHDVSGKGDKVKGKNSDKKQAKEGNSPSKKSVEKSSKKAAEMSKNAGKRGREGGEKEVAKRPKKRSRR